MFISSNPLTVKGKVIEVNKAFKQFTIKVEILDKNSEKVLRGIMKVGVIDE